MDWTFVKALASHVGHGFPAFLAAVVVLIGGRFLFLRSTPFDSRKELFRQPNPAYGVALGAYLFAAGLALMVQVTAGPERN